MISDILRKDRDLLMEIQCLLSGAGPRVSTTCHTSVTDYLSYRNIVHDILCSFVELFKRLGMPNDGSANLQQNLMF